MLSDMVKQMLQDAAADVTLIGGAFLLVRVIIWKLKKMGDGLHTSNQRKDRKGRYTHAGRSSRGRSGRGSGVSSPAVYKAVRDKEYSAGYQQGIQASGALTPSQRYKQTLNRKYGKGSLSYAAGYREGVKTREWREYVQLVRQEDDTQRMQNIYAQIEQKHAELSVLREQLQNRTYQSSRLEAQRLDIVGY